MRRTTRTTRVAAIAAATALFVTVGSAVAGHLTSGVKSYTGCLPTTTRTSSDTLAYLKEGDSPSRPCPPGSSEVHLSGGDITSISVGPGLTGGGDNGAVSIGLNAQQTLPSCSNGQVPKWNGTGWSCGADNDTQYSAGTGLDLNGTQFSIKPDYRVKNTPDCASGQFATGFDGSGTILCATPSTPGPGVWVKRVARAEAPETLPSAPYAIAASLSLPAGSYVVSFTAMADDDFHGDGEEQVVCRLTGGGTYTSTGASNDEAVPGQSMAVTDVATLSSAGTVEVGCYSLEGSDHLDDIRLVATKVGSVTTQ